MNSLASRRYAARPCGGFCYFRACSPTLARRKSVSPQAATVPFSGDSGKSGRDQMAASSHIQKDRGRRGSGKRLLSCKSPRMSKRKKDHGGMSVAAYGRAASHWTDIFSAKPIENARRDHFDRPMEHPLAGFGRSIPRNAVRQTMRNDSRQVKRTIKREIAPPRRLSP